MVNGKILLAVCSTGSNSDKKDINGIGPTSFYEYDYAANNGAGGYTQTSAPGDGVTGSAQSLKMLDLPDGTVLLSGLGRQLYVYQPDGSPLAAGKPTINKVQSNSDGSLHLPVPCSTASPRVPRMAIMTKWTAITHSCDSAMLEVMCITDPPTIGAALG